MAVVNSLAELSPTYAMFVAAICGRGRGFRCVPNDRHRRVGLRNVTS